MIRRRLNRGFIIRIGRRTRYFYLRLILTPDTPHRVALGLACGLFSGLMPIIPVQTLVAIALAYLMGGSKVTAAIGTWITNPLTIPFFYPAFYYLGRAVTPFGQIHQMPEVWDFQHLLDVGVDFLLAALIGGLIMAIVAAPPAYFLTRKYVSRIQAWERKKIRERLVHTAENS